MTLEPNGIQSRIGWALSLFLCICVYLLASTTNVLSDSFDLLCFYFALLCSALVGSILCVSLVLCHSSSQFPSIISTKPNENSHIDDEKYTEAVAVMTAAATMEYNIWNKKKHKNIAMLSASSIAIVWDSRNCYVDQSVRQLYNRLALVQFTWIGSVVYIFFCCNVQLEFEYKQTSSLVQLIRKIAEKGSK